MKAHFYLVITSIQCTARPAFVVPHLRAGFRNNATRNLFLCETDPATQKLAAYIRRIEVELDGWNWLSKCAFMHVWNCNEPASFNGAVIRELIRATWLLAQYAFVITRLHYSAQPD